MPYPYTHTTRSDGTILDQTIYNGDHVNHITHQEPTSINDYSPDVATMALQTDPAPLGIPSLTASLAGELERTRFALGSLTGTTWYKPMTGVAATAARMTREAAGVVIGIVDTIITVDTTTFGPSVMIDSTNHGLKAPVAGFYAIGGSVLAGNPLTGAAVVQTLMVALKKFGGATIIAQQDDTPAGATLKGLTVTTVVHLAAGDTIQLIAKASANVGPFIGEGIAPALWMALLGT